MKRILDFFWPLVGFAAVTVSLWLLRREFKGEAVGPEVWDHLKSISPAHYLLAILSTLVAYAALAWYDRIGLLHLGVKNISWVFISLCSLIVFPPCARARKETGNSIRSCVTPIDSVGTSAITRCCVKFS
jgi:glycosyltransferase 2 family protein